MLFLLVLAVGLVAVKPAGGSFTALSQLKVRAGSLVVVALLLQVLTISVLHDPPPPVAAALHLGSYAVAAAFLWLNRRTRGLPLAAAGGALNALAIAANGGTMPATDSALRTAGIRHTAHHFANSATVAHPRLAFLGDVFAVPRALAPLANVFSVGDVTLAVGALWLLSAAAGCRLPRSRRAAQGPPAQPLRAWSRTA